MMILNIINTIAIAIGIGTSVNNTNFNYEKKTHRNATNVTIGETISYGSTPAQSLVDSANKRTYGKYYLDNNINPNYYNTYFNIRNTLYTVMNKPDYPAATSQTVKAIYKIQNYFNCAIEINLDTRFNITNRTGTFNWWTQYVDCTGINLDQYYGMTLTNNTNTELSNLETTATQNGWTKNETGSTTVTNAPTEYVLELTTDLIRIEAKSEVQIMFNLGEYGDNIGNQTILKPNYLQITGTIIGYEQPEQEIVDIPNLMFTILTLPFSFISQGFNLTIFPNTPYEINFSNLFLTVIAIFILLWLIKHIFK